MTIFNLGSINIDHVYRLHDMPVAGRTITSAEYLQGLGGKGANQSVAAARAGAFVTHIGAVSAQGDDWVLDRLEEVGVDTRHITRLNHIATGHAVILVRADGESSIILHAGANRRLEQDQIETALSYIGPEDTLLVQNETNCQIEAARIARAAGARVVYYCTPFDAAAVAAILPEVSMLALNARDLPKLAELLPDGAVPPPTIVNCGADGAEYHDASSGRVIRQPGFSASQMDRTGSGDCLIGYFIAGMDMGQELADALRYATAAAAITVTRCGAADAMPEAAEVLDYLIAQEMGASRAAS